MDLYRNRPGESPSVDVMRLDILMQYYSRLGNGIAALRWVDPLQGGELIEAHLIALLYGHILVVHQATRDELFARVGKLAKQNIESKGSAGFEFAPWRLQAVPGADECLLWPWQFVTPEQITEPKVYSAILKLGTPTSSAPSGRWIHLETAKGLEQILAPSSALIAIAGFSRDCGREGRYLLARLLWQMNLFWRTPDMAALFGEGLAYASAESSLRSRPFHLP